MCLPADWMCVYVWGIIEVYEKLSSLNDCKYTNFIRTKNITYSSPIFSCMSEGECSESLRLESEKAKRESYFHKHEIYRFPSYMTGSKSKIYLFFCAGQVPLGFKMQGHSWRHQYVTTLSNQVPETT